MGVVIVTGSGGLVGSAVARHYAKLGHSVVGIDNNMRSTLFGVDGSVAPVIQEMKRLRNYNHFHADIEDSGPIDRIFSLQGQDVTLVVHAAAQPAHDWADQNPAADFRINAMGTLNVLEGTRLYCPGATFIHFSTIKVYGPHPNALPLIEGSRRYDLSPTHRYYNGIDETMSIDGGPLRGGGQGWGPHSMFGASKASADLMVQEYGHAYGMRTVVLRPSCLTGGAHAAAEQHGFLAYLIRCAMERRPYQVFGYDGKQVRDQLHVSDVVTAVEAISEAPPPPGSVFNLGGGRDRSTSIREAIVAVEGVTDRYLDVRIRDQTRRGDHMWWITDSGALRARYKWEPKYSLNDMAEEIYESNRERWRTS